MAVYFAARLTAGAGISPRNGVSGMTERDMKKLSRLELLEILLAQGREIERLRGEIAALEQRLEDAPAAVPVVPAPAETPKLLRQETAAVRADGAVDVLAEAKALLGEVEALQRETETTCRALHERTEEECAALREDAKRKARAYWNEVSSWVREGTATGQWDERT